MAEEQPEGSNKNLQFNINTSRPPPPVLLVDGHDLGDEEMEAGVVDLTDRLDILSTCEEMHSDGEIGSTSAMDSFDRVIGAMEDIVVGDEFQALQNYFLSTYWTKFVEKGDESLTEASGDYTEEKHEHFKIFKTYSQEMAHLLESQLKKVFRDEHFDFNQFVEDFTRRVEGGQDDESSSLFESEIFEMLFTLTDFVKFKELFTDYKEMMEGKTPNLATGITLGVKPVPSPTAKHY